LYPPTTRLQHLLRRWQTGAQLHSGEPIITLDRRENTAPSVAPEGPPGKLLPRFERFAEFLFAALLAVALVVLLVEGVARVRAPFQVEYGEGNVLASSLRVAHGQSAYVPLTGPPYVFSQYGPLLYWVEALLLRAFGEGFAAGRALSLAMTFAAAALLVLLLRRWTGSWRIALLFGTLYAALPEVGVWSATYRADPLAVALSLAGLYLFVATEHSPRRVGLYLAAFLFVAAIWVKPTLVAAPAAVFLYLLSRKRTRDALAFGAIGICTVLGSFFLMQHATAGWFYFQLFRTHPEPYTLAHYAQLAGWIVREDLVLVIMAAAFIGWSLRGRQLSLPFFYLAMALLASLSAGIAGATTNHLLDFNAALCVGAGMAYQVAGESTHPLPHSLRSAALIVMVASALLFSTFAWAGWEDTAAGPLETAARMLPYQQRVFPVDLELPQECAELQDFLRALPGDDVISEQTGAALLAGKRLLITDPYSYAQLVERAGWVEAPIDERIRRGQVAAVVLARDIPRLRSEGSPRWTPQFLNAVEQGYTLVRSFDCPNGRAVYLPPGR
jgi:hypothetical protein